MLRIKYYLNLESNTPLNERKANWVKQQTADILLGLIGDNIAASRSPRFHVLAGKQNNITVQYDRLIPTELDKSFDAVFDACQKHSYRGVNITYPHKETAFQKVEVTDSIVAAIGAVNTVLFGAGEPLGYNTDYSGFISAYTNAFESN